MKTINPNKEFKNHLDFWAFFDVIPFTCDNFIIQKIKELKNKKLKKYYKEILQGKHKTKPGKISSKNSPEWNSLFKTL